MEWLADLGLAGFFTTDRLLGLAKALATLAVGFVLARFISRGVSRLVGKRATKERQTETGPQLQRAR